MTGRCNKLARFLAVPAMLAAMAAPSFAADEVAPEDPNTGALTFTGGVDITNAYYFRGIGQENQGLIIQPYAGLAVGLVQTDSFSLSLGVGIWNSLHNGPTGTQDFGDFRADPQLWYEADFIASLDLTCGKFGASLIYTAYMSPNDSFETIQELAVKVKYDDSDLLGAFKLSPYILVAFELDDQADFGNSVNGDTDTQEGVYVEVGIAPGFTLIESKTMPVSISFPVVAGFSLTNYYEDPDDADDDCFGYVSVGVLLGVPLPMPAKYGSWSLVAGVNYMLLGDNVEELSSFNGTGGSESVVIAKFGISIAY